MRISSADWFKAGVARQRVGPISLGLAPRACTILSKPLLLLLLLILTVISIGGEYSPLSRRLFLTGSRSRRAEGKREEEVGAGERAAQTVWVCVT